MARLRYHPDRRPDDDPLPPLPAPAAHAPWLDEQLFGRRMLFVRDLEPDTAARAAATLLALDAMSADPITLHMSADQGALSAAWTLVDALDAVHAPVHATAIGQVGAAALGVFCAATKRAAFPHARFRLAEPKVTSPGGTADQVVAEAGRYLRDLEDLVLRIAAATGRPRSRVEDDLQSGTILSAEDALAYGLITEIVTR
ncbi:ATP-dependent Clp protease proteolytic subunit [Dactylosporangium sp. AC04546]|uniref:ATP-dependent Clp protease proteolytic subunit n=1 Tax=Dactylosporangium sp. AC04546 TaxID=2862460 RepID=UPI001EDE142B|nr:ATP-dependent Clp protease proteolytic subunit [Dactylosporangium sp. AC04546]WVK86101.1 ATP-dependent Clp protease proteolytic subunit [Dactylosporangium sp. AC04546]